MQFHQFVNRFASAALTGLFSFWPFWVLKDGRGFANFAPNPRRLREVF